jgi:hypothetical protein
MDICVFDRSALSWVRTFEIVFLFLTKNVAVEKVPS